jgi:hypothetical protein
MGFRLVQSPFGPVYVLVAIYRGAGPAGEVSMLYFCYNRFCTIPVSHKTAYLVNKLLPDGPRLLSSCFSGPTGLFLCVKHAALFTSGVSPYRVMHLAW